MSNLTDIMLAMLCVVVICFLFAVAIAIVKSIINMIYEPNTRTLLVVAYNKQEDRFEFLTDEQKEKFLKSEIYKRITENERS